MNPDSIARPTRVRYRVLAFLGVLAFIFYVDRVCISKAAPAIQEELGIDNEHMGFIFSAFTLAYCLFEVPTGAWGDRHGSRGVMTRIVVWWSAFTALTGAALGFWSLLGIRFLFGAGEAGAFPNTARILARWFPADRRAPAQGLINTTALIGGAAAPVAATYLIDAVGWRWAFVLFALPGIVWALVFHRWFRDNPAEHPAVNYAESRLIAAGTAPKLDVDHPSIPWLSVLTSMNVWLLGGVIACTAFNSYLYFTWYPTYLMNGRGVSDELSGWLSGLVLLAGAAGSTTGGFLADAFVRRFGRRWGRRTLGAGALALAAGLLLMGVWTDHPVAASAWTAGAVFAAFATLASWWGAVTDISGRNLGALFGLMNSMGGVGAVLSPLFVGWFVQKMETLGYTGRERWDPVFFIYASVLAIGAVGWLFIDSNKPIEPSKI